jgi:hypothetical protein
MNKNYKLSILVAAFSLCGGYAFAQSTTASAQTPATTMQAPAPGSGDQCPGGPGGPGGGFGGPGGPGGGFGGPGGPGGPPPGN